MANSSGTQGEMLFLLTKVVNVCVFNTPAKFVLSALATAPAPQRKAEGDKSQQRLLPTEHNTHQRIHAAMSKPALLITLRGWRVFWGPE